MRSRRGERGLAPLPQCRGSGADACEMGLADDQRRQPNLLWHVDKDFHFQKLREEGLQRVSEHPEHCHQDQQRRYGREHRLDEECRRAWRAERRSRRRWPLALRGMSRSISSSLFGARTAAADACRSRASRSRTSRSRASRSRASRSRLMVRGRSSSAVMENVGSGMPSDSRDLNFRRLPADCPIGPCLAMARADTLWLGR